VNTNKSAYEKEIITYKKNLKSKLGKMLANEKGLQIKNEEMKNNKKENNTYGEKITKQGKERTILFKIYQIIYY